MDRWDVLIILVAAYLAVMVLVRMMAQRRNQLVDHIRQRIQEQQNGNNPSSDQNRDETDRGVA